MPKQVYDLAKSTPPSLPYNVASDGVSIVQPHPDAPNSTVGYIVARCVYATANGEPTLETKAAAQLIKKACNNHAKLIAALDLAEATIERLDKKGSAAGTLDVIRQALLEAK